MPTRKKTRKHGHKKEENAPPSDARPPIDYREEAVRAIHVRRPRYDEH